MTVNLVPILDQARQTLADHNLPANPERMATVFAALSGLCLSHAVLAGDRDLEWQTSMKIKIHTQIDNAMVFMPGMNFDLH